MPSLNIKLKFFNPITDSYYESVNDVKVQVILANPANENIKDDSIDLYFDENTMTYVLNNPQFEFSKDHLIRIEFDKTNFSAAKQVWLSDGEVLAADLPVLIPATLPYWDTNFGWGAASGKSEKIFSGSGLSRDSSHDNPFTIHIPLREIFNVGHRGAPYHYPENTIASFRKALELGANALEFDLCLTKDNNVIVFHDSQPVAISAGTDRRLFEPYPYELISPSFLYRNGIRYFSWKKYTDGVYVDKGYELMSSFSQLDIINLTVDEVRKYYHFDTVNGQNYEIPTLEEFLDFVAENNNQLRLLFFDIKHANSKDDETLMENLGNAIGFILQKYPKLPEYLVISSPKTNLLEKLRKAILETGEVRCRFAYDAAGGLDAVLADVSESLLDKISQPFRWFAGLFTPKILNPIKIARKLGNKVVSIGSLLRPSSEKEIREAAYDRDFNNESPVEIILHWTLNEPRQFIDSLKLGVNGILTDRPDELKRILQRFKVKIM